MTEAVLARETKRRQLQHIISGLSDGVMLIEVDQTIIWANEASLRMHGVDDISQLGANGDCYRELFSLRYRNNHFLEVDQYPISRVAAGEVFSDVLIEVSRVGDEDERRRVHRVRSLILEDSSGAVESLVLIMADATEWAIAEQRFEKTFNANPAPAVICRLSDLRFVKVNQGFLEMTGHSREDVIGRSVYEVDVLENAERRDLAIERLGQGATIPQMQAELKMPEGGTKLVIVAGQPLDMNEEDCMLFSFIDLETRRKAETALRQSEERFAKTFRLTPVPIFVCTADRQQIVDANEAFFTALGFTATELIGRTVTEMAFINDGTATDPLFDVLETTGRIEGRDLKVRKKSNEIMDCVLAADTVTIQDNACYLFVFMDISERKRSELELVEAIEAVMKDASWFSQTLIEKLANAKRVNAHSQPSASFTDLTAREREVLGLICEGLADKEIAARLNLALNTIRNHVATVYSKLGVHSRAEAIVWARQRHLFAGQGLSRR
ncbi:helix-turn-helix transcriptional regulator [Pseudomonas typographi]|uniref:PAS domain S-box protein n=1 Tax=Pseudomonas typographi TaxID=2715964 RepID=A0ABR7Z2N7_9PSED|nr:PAS domain S-box protein [Pseudomonas typographi]MBD1553136.1 PAS domain S-box protein [Pseudomonas typographi]MBD1599758.1 PAS domain S-box protein [Pseudomonas typographi]